MRAAAFFDMDNTVLRIETGMSWVRFMRRRGELSSSMVAKVAYWYTLYKLAVLDMDSVFRKLIADIEGDSEADMIANCEVWYRDVVAPAVVPGARVAIELSHSTRLSRASIFMTWLLLVGSSDQSFAKQTMLALVSTAG